MSVLLISFKDQIFNDYTLLNKKPNPCFSAQNAYENHSFQLPIIPPVIWGKLYGGQS